MTELVYREISCKKAVNGASFGSGNQDYDFSIGAPSAWIPSLTYFKVSSQLTAVERAQAGGAAVVVQPTHNDQLTYAEHFTSCLYNGCKFEAGGQEVSAIGSFVPQAQALKMRCTKSGAWANTVGKAAYWMEADFQKRVSQIAFDDTQFAEDQMSYIAASIGNANTVSIANDGKVSDSGSGGFNYGNFQVGDLVYMRLFSDDGKVNAGAIVEYTVTTAGGTGVFTLSYSAAAGVTIVTSILYGLRPVRRDGGQRNIIFALWQPPIGIFRHSDPMGSGDYRFSLNPNSNYQRAAVESSRLNGNNGPGVAPDLLTGDLGLVPSTDISAPSNGDYSLNILDVKLYVAVVKAAIPRSITNLALVEMELNTQSLTSGTSQSFTFTVKPSTMALAVFIQSANAGYNTFISPTRFVQNANPAATSFNSQNRITEIQITYANTSKPSTKWVSAYDNALTSTGSINQLQQRYHDDLIETQMIVNPGGAESFGEWIQRGPYFYYSFVRDREDRSTQVQVQITFAANAGPEQGSNIFLASFYSRVTEISVADGQVQQVRGLDR